jgi:hypothetical protein
VVRSGSINDDVVGAVMRDRDDHEPVDRGKSSPDRKRAPVAKAQDSGWHGGSPLGGVLAAGNAAVGRLLAGGGRPRVGPTLPATGNAAAARLLGGPLRRSAAGPAMEDPSRPPEGFVSSVRASGGGSLPAGFRAQAERSFGADFSGVRVHTDPAAADAAHDVSARAFTVGSDIYFGAGRYDPDSAGGRHLLAHELTHVAQQSTGPATLSASSWLSQPGDATERAADAAADRFAAGEPAMEATPTQQPAESQRRWQGPAVQRAGEPEQFTPQEAPNIGVPGTPGSRRELSDLERRVLGAWAAAYQGPYSPIQGVMIDVSGDVQTIAGLVRQEVFKYEFGRDKVKQDLADIMPSEASSLEAAIVEAIFGIPLSVSGLGAISIAAAAAIEAIASIATDQAVNAALNPTPETMATARTLAEGLADEAVLKSASFDGLLRVMDALNMANRRSNEHTQLRVLNDLRAHIFARNAPIDADADLAKRATDLLNAASANRVNGQLAALKAKVNRSLREIRVAVNDGAFTHYEKIWLLVLQRSERLRRALNPNPGWNTEEGPVARRLVKAGVAEWKEVLGERIEQRPEDEEKWGVAYSRHRELAPLVGYAEHAAEQYQIVFGVVPVPQ